MADSASALAGSLKYVEGALDVDLHVLLGREGPAGLEGRTEMYDGVDSGNGTPDVVERLQMPLSHVRADVSQLGSLRIARHGEAEQAMAVLNHATTDVGANASGGASHQDSHARITTSLGAPTRS